MRSRTFRLGEILALDDLSFNVHVGGPEGSGKSTLLRVMAGELSSAGESISFLVGGMSATESAEN